MLNHAYVGGVTGGYIVAGFNPSKGRANFQKVCDYILDRRAEFLGENRPNACPRARNEALSKLKRYAVELGLDPKTALEALVSSCD
jgi:hypothetical protein